MEPTPFSSSEGEPQQPKRDFTTVNLGCCCFNMRKISRAVTQYFDRQLESSGIRITQFTLLVALSTVSARTLTEIADTLVMDRTTLTRNLKPLEKLGFISTVQTADRRSKAYILTDKGKEVLEKSYPLWEKAQQSILSHLGEENYHQILHDMKNVLNAVSHHKS